MSTVIVDQLAVDETSPLIPLTQLGPRIVKSYRATYTSGQWNPTTTYAWVPGMFYDYTPAYSTTRIRVVCHIPYAGINVAHAISSWIFYSNTSTEQGRHSISGEHLEDFSAYQWDFASWGTTSGRIGYQMRSHAEDNNEVRVYTTRYWEGAGSNQNCYGQFIIEEYIPGV